MIKIEIELFELEALMKMVGKTSEYGRIQDFGLTAEESEAIHNMYDRLVERL